MICNKTPVKHRKLIGKQFIKPYHKPAITGVCISGVCTPSWAGLWHMRPSDGAGQHSSPRFSHHCAEARTPKGLLDNLSLFLPLSAPCSALPQHMGYRQPESVRALPSLAVSVRSGTMLSFSLSVYWVSGL